MLFFDNSIIGQVLFQPVFTFTIIQSEQRANKSATELNFRNVETKFEQAEVAVWYGVYYKEGEAQLFVKTKGINMDELPTERDCAQALLAKEKLLVDFLEEGLMVGIDAIQFIETAACSCHGDYNDFRDCVEDRICEEVNDRVEPHPNIANCPAINCVLNDIKFNSDGTNKFCMDYGALIDDQDWNVIVSSPETFFGPDGRTDVNYAMGEIIVKINRGDCGQYGDDEIDYLDLAGTLYHEFQHAKFYWDVINEPGFDVSNESEYWQAWQEYARDELGIAYRDHHQAMLEDYIRREAEFLWELNGRKLTVEHYMYMAYKGVERTAEHSPSFDDSLVEGWKELHAILESRSDNYNCNE